MYYCDRLHNRWFTPLKGKEIHLLLKMCDPSDNVRLSSSSSTGLFLRGGLGEIVESLAALELGVLDDT
jgi:hypothetical protein